NFLEPHMPFYGPLDDLHDPEEITLPKNYDDPLEEDEPLAYRLKRAQYRKNGFEGHDLTTEAGWRRLIANYWGLCSQVDLSVGEILNTLENEGLADNTVVVYTSDHGDMMGAHQLLAKTVMYEESTRVPWLMRIPSQGSKQQIVHNPVSHVDMAPTLLDLLGKPMDEALPGHSLTGLMKEGKAVEDHVFIEWNPAGTNDRANDKNEEQKALLSFTRTVVSPDGWKLCLNTQDKHQLFNLNEDPGETKNLFHTGQHKERIAAFTKQIHRW
ncbi:MAG: sulfatase-like hydrolase/transferase, partial [bacterium]